MNALEAWLVVTIVAVGIVALVWGAWLHWGRRGLWVSGVCALVIILFVWSSPPASRLLSIAFGGPHPCGDGRTCIPEAGISLVLPSTWRETDERYRYMFVAAPGGKGRTGIGLTAGLDVLSPLPTELTSLEEAVRQLRTVPSVVFEGPDLEGVIEGVEAEAERIELAIGEAVRVRYVAPEYWAGWHQHIDYWFYAGSRMLVLTYVDGPADHIPRDSPAVLDDIVQSISLIE
jgi:hypothetical protein